MDKQEIYKLKSYMKDYWSFQKTSKSRGYNLYDPVFFALNEYEIGKGSILGIEVPSYNSSEYIYKILISDKFVNHEKKGRYIHLGDNPTMTCYSIFKTLEEAKEFAIEQLERRYKLQKGEIERYFEQYI